MDKIDTTIWTLFGVGSAVILGLLWYAKPRREDYPDLTQEEWDCWILGKRLTSEEWNRWLERKDRKP